ncbi:MAG TPA: nucleotidyltransferase [Acidimicrobiales bacterium]|jgi:hypothetical protein
MPTTATGTIGWLLANVAEIVDLPPDLYQAADEQYRLVGQFLADRSDGEGWDVYPQGSIRLGTVVRPFADERGFDLDMVCRRDVLKSSTTQEALKDEVGDALAEYLEANQGTPGAPSDCTPSRRCWTLHYPTEFHMDVLPAIPDPDATPTGILLTDKKLTRWLASDPVAYANWFRRQMATEFLQRKAALATEMRKSIEQVPDWQVKTTLQQLVQVLKVHRDLHFREDLDDRPPSILITTLAAYAYDGNSDLFEAILHVVAHMGDYMEPSTTGPRVTSPVSDENFADKWREYPQRELKFRTWLDKVTIDLEEASDTTGLRAVTARLGEGFGAERITKAAAQMGIETRELRETGKLGVVGGAVALSTAATAPKIPSHRFYGSTTR